MISGDRARPGRPSQSARPAPTRVRRTPSRGQALAELALVVPFLFLLVVAIADFGRLYNSMVAIEAAAREAADYGSFKSSYWDASLGNPPITTAEMRRRACTAAWGSHLQGYEEPVGAVNHDDCINPSVDCMIEPTDGSPPEPCATYADSLCSTSTTDPPCTIHVSVTYTFRPFLNIQILNWSPLTFDFTRESLFRISDLPTP